MLSGTATSDRETARSEPKTETRRSASKREHFESRDIFVNDDLRGNLRRRHARMARACCCGGCVLQLQLEEKAADAAIGDTKSG